MTIFIGANHNGFNFKELIGNYLKKGVRYKNYTILTPRP